MRGQHIGTKVRWAEEQGPIPVAHVFIGSAPLDTEDPTTNRWAVISPESGVERRKVPTP